jgi:hypothetical protein
MENKKLEQLGIIAANFNNEDDQKLVNEARQHFQNSNSLKDLIFDWISPTRSVIIVNADCDPGNEEGFMLNLKERNLDLGLFVISMAWLKERYPAIKPATEWELTEENVQEKEWCGAVADHIISTEDNFKVIVSYILTENSHITVDGDLDHLLENCPEEELQSIIGKQLISVMPSYQNLETGKGFGEDRWSAKSLN